MAFDKTDKYSPKAVDDVDATDGDDDIEGVNRVDDDNHPDTIKK